MPDITAAQRRLRAAQDRARRAALGKPLAAPSDDELTALAAVGPESAASAESLWDFSQRQHKTGLEGLLSATVSDA